MCPKERSPRAAWKYKKRRRRGKIGVACPLLFGKRFWKAGRDRFFYFIESDLKKKIDLLLLDY